MSTDRAGATPAADHLREGIARLIGDAKSATDGLLERLARSVADVRDHDHPKHEDLYCMNLTSWSGERMAPVLRRLIEAEAEVERLRADRAEVLAEAAEVAVRAARGCGENETGQYAASVVARVGAELRRMARADGQGEKDTPMGATSTRAKQSADRLRAYSDGAARGRAGGAR